MPSARESSPAQVLDDGTVLLVGGGTYFGHYQSAPPPTDARYDPVAHQWSAVEPGPRSAFPGPSLVKLPDGRVLASGITGYDSGSRQFLLSLQVFDPAANHWTKLAAPANLSGEPVSLLDGRVLFTGEPSQIYDPASQSFHSVPGPENRQALTAPIRLADGRVFAFGGYPQDGSAVAEIFDPASSGWTRVAPIPAGGPAPPFIVPRLLHDGRVFVAPVLIYDPGDNTWKSVGAPPLPDPHPTSSVLPNGLVLITGVRPSPRNTDRPLGAAALYNPDLNLWTPAAAPQARRDPSVAVLPDRRVLLAGGITCHGDPVDQSCMFEAGTLSNAEIYQLPTTAPKARRLRARTLGHTTETRRLSLSFQLNEPDRVRVRVEQARSCHKAGASTGARACMPWRSRGPVIAFDARSGLNHRLITQRTLRVTLTPGRYRITLQPDPVGWPAKGTQSKLNIHGP